MRQHHWFGLFTRCVPTGYRFALPSPIAPLTGVAVLMAIASPLSSTPALAEQQTETLVPLTFNSDAAGSFDDQGRPRSRTSGGARGNCSEQLIALLPGTEVVSDEACGYQSDATLALTVSDVPTFWFHIPQREQSTFGEFVIMDDSQQALVVETLPLPPNIGIIGIQVEQPLDIDQSYQWVFSLLDYPDPSQNPAVEGRISRIAPMAQLADALNRADSPREQAAAFAQHGIWHNALTHMITLRQHYPDDGIVRQDWDDFLHSVGLGAIANTPILDCCSSNR